MTFCLPTALDSVSAFVFKEVAGNFNGKKNFVADMNGNKTLFIWASFSCILKTAWLEEYT